MPCGNHIAHAIPNPYPHGRGQGVGMRHDAIGITISRITNPSRRVRVGGTRHPNASQQGQRHDTRVVFATTSIVIKNNFWLDAYIQNKFRC